MCRAFTILLTSILIFLTACSQGNTTIEQEINEKADSLKLFPEFNQLSKGYVKTKKKVSARFFKEHIGGDAFSGMFLVAKNGVIIFERTSGFRDRKNKERLTADSPIHVASISKVATALAILRLCDQGKIGLDEDIRTYLPGLPYEGVTVRMLLNHRSGIPYYGYFTFRTWHLGTTLSNRDILKLIKKHRFPMNFKPNKKFAYCNTNYALLALIAENVSGVEFPELMKQLIFDPLGMNHSFIANANTDFKTISPSYDSRWREQEFNYLDAVYGDKNLYTTARDLLKMDMATYSPHFVSDSLKTEMFRGYSYEKRGKANYGLGIRMSEEKDKETYFFHTGWWHGSTGCYTTLRADTTCIIAISNKYTRSVYLTKSLAPHFGNYPYGFVFE
jgi:CubicO group peptidase (beta-lactamase class C family)